MFFDPTITTLEQAKTRWYELVRLHFFDEPTLKAINVEYQELTAQLRAAEIHKASAATALVVQPAVQYHAPPPQPPSVHAQRPKRKPKHIKQSTPKRKRRRQRTTAANNFVDALVDVGIAGLRVLAERWKT